MSSSWPAATPGTDASQPPVPCCGDHWGKGIASRALSLFLVDVDTRPLYAHVAKHNTASIRVLEKCGFVVVGEDTIAESNDEIEELILRLDRAG